MEERLANEVRKYKNLYDPSHHYYKNTQICTSSWIEIGRKLNEDPGKCKDKWKTMRDRYVRIKRKIKLKSGDSEAHFSVPAHYTKLSWLEGYVSHREKQINFSINEAEAGSPLALQRSASAHMLVSDSTASHGMSSDDEAPPTEVSSVSTPFCQPTNKRRKVTAGHIRVEDLLESIATFRQENMARCEELISQLNAAAVTRDYDEYSTFARAVADSLRKLPPERVEATKFKLFAVLAEAHLP
ncbi:uncharacterized protein LOC117524545 [Thalassophryne amazonica]|uniref:uncharacterized protein LOC117524545 n=1 Tax=Thalassophryne amazonica TaxID=390379 RepID=UPI001470EDB3|nr:uncharacterized protein LOC117524545 [Thalassophryne amazonica]XP_034042240.1 uncharacterized protein LOC117524545 [Thalassophryne amazonica]